MFWIWGLGSVLCFGLWFLSSGVQIVDCKLWILGPGPGLWAGARRIGPLAEWPWCSERKPPKSRDSCLSYAPCGLHTQNSAWHLGVQHLGGGHSALRATHLGRSLLAPSPCSTLRGRGQGGCGARGAGRPEPGSQGCSPLCPDAVGHLGPDGRHAGWHRTLASQPRVSALPAPTVWDEKSERRAPRTGGVRATREQGGWQSEILVIASTGNPRGGGSGPEEVSLIRDR